MLHSRSEKPSSTFFLVDIVVKSTHVSAMFPFVDIFPNLTSVYFNVPEGIHVTVKASRFPFVKP